MTWRGAAASAMMLVAASGCSGEVLLIPELNPCGEYTTTEVPAEQLPDDTSLDELVAAAGDYEVEIDWRDGLTETVAITTRVEDVVLRYDPSAASERCEAFWRASVTGEVTTPSGRLDLQGRSPARIGDVLVYTHTLDEGEEAALLADLGVAAKGPVTVSVGTDGERARVSVMGLEPSENVDADVVLGGSAGW